MSRILVTGGAGFIGSRLTAELVRLGHEVIVLDDLRSGNKRNVSKDATLVKGDIVAAKTWRKLPDTIDAVFHLAAQIDVRASVADSYDDAQNNLLGTINVLEYARKAGAKRVVFSSTGGAVYGPTDSIPTSENVPCHPSSPYGLSKWAAERYIELYQRLHGLPCTILRYSNVYGPGQDGSKESGVIAIFTKLAMAGKPLTIYGDGEQTRDFVYVDDVVAANLKALETSENVVVNIATGVETSINQLADMLQVAVGKPLVINREAARAGEERRSCLDNSLAKTKLGWEPKHDLALGLKETIAALQA